MSYKVYGYDENQIPIELDFVEGKKSNLPFPITLPQVDDASTITGLDINQVQIVFNAADNGIYISPIGQSTYTVHYAPAI